MSSFLNGRHKRAIVERIQKRVKEEKEVRWCAHQLLLMSNEKKKKKVVCKQDAVQTHTSLSTSQSSSRQQATMTWQCLCHLRTRFLLVTTFGVLFTFGIYLWSSLFTDPTTAAKNSGLFVGGWQRPSPVGDLIRTPGCVIPQFDPFDPSVRPYFVRRSNCSRCRGKPNFLTVRDGFPAVHEEKLKKHGVLPDDLACFYKEIRRDDSLKLPDDRYVFGPEQPLLFNRPLTKEFLYVECATRQSPGRRFHDQFLLNPLIKENVEERCRNKLGSTPHKLSVFLLVLDSVSYLNFERHLPDTAQFLREKLGALQLRGYNKVGDNSYPNHVALLTGLKDFEADRAASDGFYDNLTASMIWSRYGERGYRSLFEEERPYFGIFNYFSHGFRHTPADYYLRHILLAIDDSPKKTRDRLDVRCLGPTMPCEELLDYLARFTALMAERPFFAYASFIDITHDNLNSAGYADEPFRRFLETLHVSGALNRTILVFLSDHGLRFGDIRATYIGRFEDREPFAFLAFPPWFLKQNPEVARALRVNQHRLTTPFDVHATLVELLGYPDIERPNTTYGLSLLHEVPDTRTCADASIIHHWCTCGTWADVAVSSALASSLANLLVSTINGMVARQARKCVEYRLLQVLDVTALQQTTKERAANITHYWVNVLLSPGGTLFEGTVRVQGDTMALLSDISRMDMCWSVSHCAREHWLEKYCHCRRMTAELLASL